MGAEGSAEMVHEMLRRTQTKSMFAKFRTHRESRANQLSAKARKDPDSTTARGWEPPKSDEKRVHSRFCLSFGDADHSFGSVSRSPVVQGCSMWHESTQG